MQNLTRRKLKQRHSVFLAHYCLTTGLLFELKCVPPVTDVASEHLGEAVAPEEAAQHHAGLPLAPVELLCHADGTDGHRHAGAVEEARPEQQHHRPYPRHWPARGGSRMD